VRTAAAFVVKDRAAQKLALYYEDRPAGRQAAHEGRGAADRGQLCEAAGAIAKRVGCGKRWRPGAAVPFVNLTRCNGFLGD